MITPTVTAERYRKSQERDSRTRINSDPMRRVDEIIRDAKEETPVWKGDHTFSVEAAAYSLSNFLEPEIAKSHPDWNPSQIREAALERFEKRLSQDLSYERRETAHEDSAVRWQIIETSPGVKELATEYGNDLITLRELWDHTREFAEASGNPQAYNKEEERAQLSMQDAFIGGTTDAFVSVLSHPEAVRYVQVWERQSDGEVVSKQIDLSVGVGRDLTHGEADAVVDKLAKYSSGKAESVTTDKTSSYAHFFIEGGKIGENDIQTIAMVQLMHEEFVRSESRSPAVVIRETRPGVAADIMRMAAVSYQYVRDAVGGKIQVLKDAVSKERVTAVSAGRPVGAKSETQRSSERPKPRNPKKQEHAHSAPRENTVRSLVADVVISRTILSVAPLVPSGAHAALAWFELSRTRQSLPKETKKIPFGQRVRMPEQVTFNTVGSLSEFIAAVRRRLAKIPEEMRKTVSRDRRESRAPQRERVLRRVRMKRIELPKRVNVKRSERPSDAGPMILRLLTLIETVRMITRIDTPQKAGSGSVALPSEGYREVVLAPKIKETLKFLERYAIARIIWLFVSADPKKYPVADDGAVRSAGVGKDTSERERTPDRKAAPWLLFAIIWYLSQLREAGFGAYAQGAAATTSNAAADDAAASPQDDAVPVLPLSGIIFIRREAPNGFTFAS